jgi:hypothetical protein
MNGVHQSDWISMTSGVLVILLHDGGVSWDDSVTLVTFANAFEMLASWCSYRKTPVGTMARLERSLANSSITSFFPHKICKYLRPSNFFLT